MQARRAAERGVNVGFAPLIPIHDANPCWAVNSDAAHDVVLGTGRSQVQALLPIGNELQQEMPEQRDVFVAFDQQNRQATRQAFDVHHPSRCLAHAVRPIVVGAAISTR